MKRKVAAALASRNGKRVGTYSTGFLVANFVISLFTDTLKIDIHPNTIVTGSLAIMVVTNLLVSKYFK